MPEAPTPSPGGAATRALAPLQTQAPHQAQALLALLALTHAQEAQRLGLQRPPPFSTTVASLQAEHRFTLGAWVGGTLVGALTLGPDDEAGQIAIQTLVVHPDHQRQGHGLALLQQALQRAQGLVLAVVVGAANSAAVALYRSQGFVVYRQGLLALATGPATRPEDSGGVLMLKMRRSAAS